MSCRLVRQRGGGRRKAMCLVGEDHSGQGYVDQPGRREERATRMNDGDGGERQAMVDLGKTRG